MNIKETYQTAEGRIKLLSIGSGEPELILEKSNVIVYNAADILAHTIAGSADWVPRHIGFIYGENADPGDTMQNPDTLPVETRRLHDWGRISTDTAAANANMLICPLIMPPSVTREDVSSDRYMGNQAMFTSHTGVFTEYAFDTGSGGYAGTLDTLSSIYFYQAVLLTRFGNKGRITYIPFSRVSLGTSPFVAKADNRELAVYWSIIFK